MAWVGVNIVVGLVGLALPKGWWNWAILASCGAPIFYVLGKGPR